MKYFALRGVAAVALFTAGLLAAKNSIETGGMAGPRNPAWRLVDQILSTEWEIVKGIGWIILILGVLMAVVIGVDTFVTQLRERQKVDERRRVEEEVTRARDAENYRIWKEREAHEEIEREKARRERQERWLEKQAIEAALLRARTQKEVERDAIDDLTKGW